MPIFLIIFFALGEFFVFSGGSWFWLLVILLFGYFVIRNFSRPEFKNFRALAMPFLFLLLGLMVHRSFVLSFWPSQFYLLGLTLTFHLFIRFYSQLKKSLFFFTLFSILTAGLAGFFFFRSNILQGFLGKELLLFVAIWMILETDRKIFGLLRAQSIEEGSAGGASFYPAVFSIIVSGVLVELAWILTFLPINFISLMVIWLAMFYLVREFLVLIGQNSFRWRVFWPHLAIVAVLASLLMISASWGLV